MKANKIFGYTAQQTLDIAQTLYEKKLITYPRTDSQFLSNDMEAGLIAIVNALNIKYTELDTKKVINDKKVTDHHAIIPTKIKGDMADNEQNIYNLISTRFIAAMSPKHEYLETTLTLQTGSETFIAKGKTITANGFKDIENLLKNQSQEKEPQAQEPPQLTVGQTIEPITTSIKDGKTTPPKNYTEASLLSAMETAGVEDLQEDIERKGLGTPATRASVIEKLVNKGFVERKGKSMLPTQTGINLIKILPEILTSPLTTAEWENNLKKVEKGQLDKKAFAEDINSFITMVVNENQNPQEQYKDLFPKRENKATAKPLGTCPRCKNNQVTEIEKGFVCQDRNCGFALWKSNKFFANAKKKLTAKMVGSFLKDSEAVVKDLYSVAKDKKYTATLLLDDTGKFVNFKFKPKSYEILSKE